LDKQSRLRRFAKEIGKAGEQGVAWIEQLMAAARKRAVEACRLSLNNVASDLRNLLARLIGESIRFAIELAGDLGRVRMDPAEVQQIILNFIAGPCCHARRRPGRHQHQKL
jgi:two-component system cell cycle sensor histidine kinase/response regulator CckA